jgi:hypothetical protein
VYVASEDYDQRSRQGGKEQDAIGIVESVPPHGQLTRRKAVVGHDGKKHGESSKSGVCSQQQNNRRCSLNRVVHEALAKNGDNNL